MGVMWQAARKSWNFLFCPDIIVILAIILLVMERNRLITLKNREKPDKKCNENCL